MIKEWDLVLTCDGYYGIVTSVEKQTVFLANGLEEMVQDWNSLKSLPLNTTVSNGAVANFVGLFNVIETLNRRLTDHGPQFGDAWAH